MRAASGRAVWAPRSIAQKSWRVDIAVLVIVPVIVRITLADQGEFRVKRHAGLPFF